MLDAFKVKPYDLEPVYVSWPKAPIFQGRSKDDPIAWLKQIEAGCLERKVPKEHWHRVARHYLAPKPRERFEQLAQVMTKMSGDKKVSWNWKKFSIAMENLGLGTASTAKKDTPKDQILERPLPKKQGSWFILGKSEPSDKEKEELVIVARPKLKALPPVPLDKSNSAPTEDTTALTTISKAPVWLVNACTALDFLTAEHPKVMSAMSAILITIGALPSIPALIPAASGTVLASAGVQAAGAIAGGLGHWLKAQQDGQLQVKS
ncbi:hypothetical protein BD410DRAFT_796885 [Rickenella mellea]|uniref:Uncharacterized protein n=1 Tax=Rickenella mellea TaxID=50990 RepID=A0A4Y7PIH5_9AGAM|nr:hypothetical protein BD410DRAFT_796885 [Rickenella mellea]